ncbi:MAG: N-acetylmuramoyl-L-alanine amidase [Breznakibacter sp.]
MLCVTLFFRAGMAQSPANGIKPNPGEGTNAFLLRNGLNPLQHMKAFVELNTGKFGKENTLLAHHIYFLPTINDTFTEPLFGEALKEATIKTNELTGATFYLISGHGGPDPGASGQYGKHKLDEDEYAYDITLRLGRCLIEKGAKVVFVVQDPNDGIRNEKILLYDNDETCMGDPIPLNQIERLRQRVDKVNQIYKANPGGYHRSVSIHLDSRSQKKQIDVFFYYYQGSPNGQNLAETLRQVFNEKYKLHQPSRGFSGTVSTRELYELKYTHPVSVFIELGNIQNTRDQQRFVIETNRQALAVWLAEGLVRDYRSHKGASLPGNDQAPKM